MSKVEKGNTVKVNYTGKLNDGTVFDTSKDREPLTFKVGEGQLIPGFEQAVLGMEEKETKTVEIPPDQAYGKRSDELVKHIPKERLPENLDPKIGEQLISSHPDGTKITLNVIDKSDTGITVDANHALAGENLIFEITVEEIK
ncbi:MAG: FKBP-type peptidyl-prolyl cis-trans isomerase [Bacteroidota bacterium]